MKSARSFECVIQLLIEKETTSRSNHENSLSSFFQYHGFMENLTKIESAIYSASFVSI
jgi:hypothetical protein